MKNRIIYGLFDPVTNELRYVGKSESGGKYRLVRHCSKSSLTCEKNHKANWIKSLDAMMLFPYLKTLKIASESDDLCQMEIETIKFYRELGANLTNLTIGWEGMSGYKVSYESRQKISKKRLGMIATKSTRLKMSKSHSGKNHHFYKKKHSDIHKNRISESLKGNFLGQSRDLFFRNAIAKSRGSSTFICSFNGQFIGQFISIREAERTINIRRKIIKKLLIEDVPHKTGYYFKYE